MEHLGQTDGPSTHMGRVEAAIDRWQRELLDLSRNNRLLYFQGGQGRRGQGGVAFAQPAPAELFDRLVNQEKRQTIVRPPSGESRSPEEDLTPQPPLRRGEGESEGRAGEREGGASSAPTGGASPVGAELAPPVVLPALPIAPLAAPAAELAAPVAPPAAELAPHVGNDPRTGSDPPVREQVNLRRDEILLDAEPARLDALLYRLRLRARSALQEQGIEILYIAFGLLDWTGPKTAGAAPERLRSPLLLLPVRLDRARAADPYTLTPLDEHPILNPALVFQVQQTYGLTLTEPEPDTDSDLDYEAALAHFREQVAARSDWSVLDGAYLGLFSFAKQAMYADLAALRSTLVRHPVVRALAGETGNLPVLALPDADHLDDREQPRETFQVLDADASQRTVLAAIRQGSSLVVQGPPGTGKSQTIANAMAEAIAQGKSVLFVSEKLAALQVVAKRLRAAGLGEFCLEAHGHGGDKAAVVKALAASVPEVQQRTASPSTDELLLLAERRAALNAYARALHDANTPLGASAFAIHGELAKRAAAPRILFDVPAIETLTGERMIRLVDLVRRLEPVAEVITAPEQHPWSGCTVARWNPLIQAQLETTLSRFARAADELHEQQSRAVTRWGLNLEPTLDGARRLTQILPILDDRPPARASWLALPTTDDLTARVRGWTTRCEEYGQRRGRLLAQYQDTVFGLDLPAIAREIGRTEIGAFDRLRGAGPAADRALTGRAAIERATRRTLDAVPPLLTGAADLAERLGLAPPATRPEVARLLQIADLLRAAPQPKASWLEPGRLGLLADLAREAGEQSERAATSRTALLERFDETIVRAITPTLADRFETTYVSWLRHVNPGWYTDIRQLRRHLRADRANEGLDHQEAFEAIQHWRELTAADGWLATQATGLANAFGRHYLGGRTDWVGIQGAIDAVRQLSDLLGDLSRWPKVSALLLEPANAATLDRPIATVRAALRELDAALADLNGVATVDGDGSSGVSGTGTSGTGTSGTSGTSGTGAGTSGTGASGTSGTGAADTTVGAINRAPTASDPVGARFIAPTGNAPTGNAPTGNAPAGNAPTGNAPAGNAPASIAPPTQPLTELAAGLEAWLAALAPLWTATDALHGSRRQPTTSVATLLAETQDALACLQFEREFGAAMPGLVTDLGPLFKGLKTDWSAIARGLAWTDRLRACFDRPPPAAFLETLDARPPGPAPEASEIARALARLDELRQEVGASFGDDGPRIGSQPLERVALPALATWARSRHAALPRLQEWIDTQALLGEVTAAGLGGFVDGLIREAPPSNLWVDAFLRQTFTLWLTWRYDREPALARFRRQDHEGIVAEHARLDRQQWEVASQRIAATLRAKRPDRTGAGTNGSEVGLLLREARKQRRFKPLRRLFAELPHLLPRLKPCLLMSPLSVAQHLGESAVTFDLVVFDEASQVLPADAIGAIGRARQVVVVGDRRQLPPTRFFQVTALDAIEGDDPDEEPPESILDACLNAGLPECSLLWHYRSRHEHLIAFSNAAFYDGRLRTFPSPDADERVVRLEHVPDGVYDRGGTRANHAEAVKVADLIVAHIEAQAEAPASERQSLGVIAFSEAQMLAILGELEARKRARPELEPLLTEEGEEGLFVKNLEAVQGDERDAILFSVGYGRDGNGRLTMTFGPLNAPGGERRLNVAVTRARRSITVVSSIRAHEIDGGPQRPAGVRQLKRYLEYAERGPGVLANAADTPIAAAGPTGRRGTLFEDAVQAALTDALADRDLEVVARVGVGEQPVDLAIRDREGRYLLAIECDGQTFADLPTARDRERLRHEVLERLGWQVHRVWSTDWIGAQRDEERRVLAVAERARQIRDGLLTDDAPLAVLKPEDRPAHGATRPQTQLRPPGSQVTPRTTPTGHPDAPESHANTTCTSTTVAAPDAADGPSATTGEPDVASSDAPTPPAPAPETDLPTPTPRSGPPPPIERIADAEIAHAARAVLVRAFAMPTPDLTLAVARELGYQRTGQRIRTRVERVVRQLLADGVFVKAGDNVSLAERDSA